ncbi:Unannotated [Lentimonas sp. CC19]|nr:Unannotated [Lentimonas sp. CC19]CAA6697365.1 Unannotated [Lentimonas sp. CC10]CAA7072364.1 Unannotated [Lentimonas sp. CC11]
MEGVLTVSYSVVVLWFFWVDTQRGCGFEGWSVVVVSHGSKAVIWMILQNLKYSLVDLAEFITKPITLF